MAAWPFTTPFSRPASAITPRTKPEEASAITGALMKVTRGVGVIFSSARRDSFSAFRLRACCSQSRSAWFSRVRISTCCFNEK